MARKTNADSGSSASPVRFMQQTKVGAGLSSGNKRLTNALMSMNWKSMARHYEREMSRTGANNKKSPRK